MRNPKILVLGHARHGKDAFVEIMLNNFANKNLQFKSASIVAAELFIFDSMKEKLGYVTVEDCYNDRVNHRPTWHQLINNYNALAKETEEPSLTEQLMEVSDFYVGMRDCNDYFDSIDLFDICVWIDASERLPVESIKSNKLLKSYADIIIENNNTLEEFEQKVVKFGNLIYK
jgi:hypothetical protein